METYTIVLLVLASIFCILLSLVFILIIKLRRRYYHEIKFTDDEPFTPDQKSALTKKHKEQLNNLVDANEASDNVFEGELVRESSPIAFSLFHNVADEVLVVDIWSVGDTPSNFIKGYIEAQLFPSDFEPGRFRTNIRESVDNCVIFNESFGIPNVNSEVLANVYLKLFMYSSYAVSQPRCVGHTVFALKDVPWNPLGKTQFKQQLRHHEGHHEASPTITDEESPCPSPSRAIEKGELYVSLRYQSNSGRINVVVLKAENIQRGNVLQSDPYVKIKLLYQGEVIEKKQTKSQRRNSSPCWNEPFVFNIEEEKGLNNYELIFLVRRRDLLSPHSTLGLVRIGAQVGGAGQSHWYAMLSKGNLMRQVARRHRIK